MQGFPCWCLWCRAFVVVVAWIGGLFVTAVVAADSSCWRDIGLYWLSCWFSIAICLCSSFLIWVFTLTIVPARNASDILASLILLWISSRWWGGDFDFWFSRSIIVRCILKRSYCKSPRIWWLCVVPKDQSLRLLGNSKRLDDCCDCFMLIWYSFKNNLMLDERIWIQTQYKSD